MAISGQLRVTANLTKTKEVGSTSIEEKTNPSAQWRVIDGIAAGEADQMYTDEITLATGANTEIDLTNLTDQLGDAFSIARVKGLVIQVTGGAGKGLANLIVGAAGANPIASLFGDVSDTLIVGECLALIDQQATAYEVVDGSADVLRIEHDAGDAGDLIFTLIIVGASA